MEGGVTTQNKTVLTIRECADEYHFPTYGLRTLIKTGKIPVIQVGSRSYIVRDVFDEFLKSGSVRYAPTH